MENLRTLLILLTGYLTGVLATLNGYVYHWWDNAGVSILVGVLMWCVGFGINMLLSNRGC